MLRLCSHDLIDVACCRCVCVSGRTASDGRSCISDNGTVIVLANGRIDFFPAHPFNKPSPFKPIVRGLRKMRAFDYDFESKLIYFAQARTIKSIYLNGTGMRVIIGGMYIPCNVICIFLKPDPRYDSSKNYFKRYTYIK